MYEKLNLARKALLQLGPHQVGLYAAYQLMLHTRIIKRRLDRQRKDRRVVYPHLSIEDNWLKLPTPAELMAILGPEGRARLLNEANQISVGQVRLFGGELVPLNVGVADSPTQWNQPQAMQMLDVKFAWEPARFGWAFTLGRAYDLTGDERYSQAFWRFTESFWEAHPPYSGSLWESAQEVALRLMAFVFAAHVFSRSTYSTLERREQLAKSIAIHAKRIPPTLTYARAQNNNHLLSEAAGLITAAMALSQHPDADAWSEQGWKWFNWGLENQIASDGEYVQHSTNYHRLMLQLALWVASIEPGEANTTRRLSTKARNNLSLATHWLLQLCDRDTGGVPNLGPNDGAYIFPFTVCPFEDYRPVLQTATRSFLGQAVFSPGTWDEMHLWLGSSPEGDLSWPESASPDGILRAKQSWAYLRAVHFEERPGHADQLHFDLWWQGLNITQDAGTYLYNAPPPWDNRLSAAFVHNTVTVDGVDQMTRAGRFLYLDWAQAKYEMCENSNDELVVSASAVHDGYQNLGILHQRTASCFSDEHWLIADDLLPITAQKGKSHTHRFILHWLLPDIPYELLIADLKLRLQTPKGWISLQTATKDANGKPLACQVSLIRGGQLLYGRSSVSPILGWFSPTYGHKVPALSLRVELTAPAPVHFYTTFELPGENE